jgi:hypothetical protein
VLLIFDKAVTGSGDSRGCGISDLFNLENVELESLKNQNSRYQVSMNS